MRAVERVRVRTGLPWVTMWVPGAVAVRMVAREGKGRRVVSEGSSSAGRVGVGAGCI